MPPCKNDPKSSYKGDEPSPKGLGYCAHAEKVGTIKKGKDGLLWIIQETSKKVRRWVKSKSDSNPTSNLKKEENEPNCKKFVFYEKRVGSRIETIRGLELEKGKIYEWKSYNKFASKPTLIRSGWKRRSISSDFKNKYYCGKKELIEKGDSKYKIIRSKHKGWKVYMTHDNGGRPFCVYISPNKKEVDVYKVDEDDTPKEGDYGKVHTYLKLVKSFKPIDVFIGKSPLNEMTRYSGGHGSEFDGNSILLKMSPTKYIFIGESIKSFKTKKEIMKYVSPVGNNDVPYPYGIDEDGLYYLITEGSTVKVPKEKKDDPYDFYYNMFDKVKDDLNIDIFYIKGTKYMMRVAPDPEKDYEDLTRRLGSPIEVKMKGEKGKKVLSKNDYVKMMKEYNEKIGLGHLMEVEIIEKRDW